MISILIALAILDLATTIVGVAKAGPKVETNELYRWLLERFGYRAFVPTYVLIVGTLIALVNWLGSAASAGVVMAIIVAHNFYVLARMFWHERRGRT